MQARKRINSGIFGLDSIVSWKALFNLQCEEGQMAGKTSHRGVEASVEFLG
jgi:hypothetical protein